ncbi:MAG TPA: SAM-dependent methyltransferase [Trebonia sp.]|jgi:hypothetical protein|nr:SAM-dependent methyltransferase [Trebonia sp.]
MQAVDTSSPSLARVYDHLLGGRANFAADRALAARLQPLYPQMADVLAFSRTYTAARIAELPPGGVCQFIDVGCGLPTRPSVHEAALRARPDARVVCVDRDPAVVAHAAALVPSALRPPASVRVIEADLMEPEALVWTLGPLLDLTRPACLVLALVVQALPDAGLARALTEVLIRALAPGSYVILTVPAGQEARLPDAATGTGFGPADMESFLAGLDLLPPGVTAGPALCATARKP